MRRGLGFLIALCLAAPVAEAGNAIAPGASCADADIPAGMQQAINQGFYLCTLTGATRNWYPQPVYIGTSSTTCDSTTVSLTRYNAGALEVCNGTSWVAASATSSIVLGSTATATNPSRSGDVTTGLFSPAAGSVAVSSAGVESLRVTATGSVGIGTSTPGYALQITNSAAVNGFGMTNSSYTGTFSIRHVANNKIQLENSAVGAFLIVGPANIIDTGGQQIQSLTRGAYFSNTQGGAALLTATGNVGIGTTTPTYPLDVNGAIRANGTILFTGLSAQNAPGTITNDSGDNLIISAVQGSGKSTYLGPINGTSVRTSASSVAFSIGNGAPSEIMRLTTTGLGIGTTSPGSLLSIRRAGSSFNFGIGVSPIDVNFYRIAKESGGVGYIDFTNSDINITGMLSVDATTIKLANPVAGQAVGTNARTIISAGTGSANAFGGFLGGDTYLLGGDTVNSDTGIVAGNVFVNGGYAQSKGTWGNVVMAYNGGKVGIGTTTPTNLLSLGGNTARTFWMERNTTANTAGNDLTVQAGGATAGATNKLGGNLVLQSGIATGTGASGILFNVVPAGASGTADNAAVNAMTLYAASANSATVGLAGTAMVTVDTTTAGSEAIGLNRGSTGAPGVTALVVGTGTSNGNGAMLSASGTWTNASDGRMKEQVQPLAYGLDKLLALRPVSYVMKGTHDPQIGFIAQEVEPVIPEVVFRPANPATDHYGLSYGNMVAVTVKAIQEQEQTIRSQQATINLLAEKVRQQEQVIEEIKHRLDGAAPTLH